MVILGSNSEVAQAFVEKYLSNRAKIKNLYLFTSNEQNTKRFAQHIYVKYLQESTIIPLDITQEIDYKKLEKIDAYLIFCATGFLGKNTQEGLYDNDNTQKIIDINYAKLIPLLNFFAKKMEAKRNGTIIALSSVAGERGRQSNFIYGSAKAGFTAYLSGLRNYLFNKKVRVMTVKPGFMDTKMTSGLPLNPKLTATPQQAANYIYKGYKNKKDEIYVLPIWWLIMLIIRNIPEFIFKKMKL
jgi:short-chain dehydrogenase/reductase family oxidoreductase